MTTATETGIVLPVAELEEVVPPLRQTVEDPPQEGLPAHITLLYPWVAPGDLEAHLDRLRSVASSVAPLRFDLAEIGWFGSDVVWARPVPDGDIRALAARLASTWPEHPPYEGDHGPDPTPHLTIAAGAAADELERAARVVADMLPMTVTVSELWVMVGTPDPPRWDVARVVPLAG